MPSGLKSSFKAEVDSDAEKEIQERFHEIWRGKRGLAKRQCLRCREMGYSHRFYPHDFEGRCIRCGSELSPPNIWCF